MNDFVVVIPSRLGSSRLKEKPLIDIAGKSLIQRVYERVQLCSTDQIYIATDSKKITRIKTMSIRGVISIFTAGFDLRGNFIINHQ